MMKMAIESILGIMGWSAGVVVSCGIVALFSYVGIFSRLLVRTNTEDYLRQYEWIMFFGVILGGICSMQEYALVPKNISSIYTVVGMSLVGLFMGMYVGVLAMSLAENLDVGGAMLYKLKIPKGYRILLWVLVLGKITGCVIGFRLI